MGCDGGTIPKRDELVRQKKKPEKNTKEVENAAKWNHCHLSQQTLQQPIVADLLGYLYNKDALIEYLLERSKYECGPAYVRNLKDVKELALTSNPGYSTKLDETPNAAKWICPITGLEMNGVYKFFFIYTCGCVISERALKSMQQKDDEIFKCLKCDKVYSKNLDLIVLNGSDDDVKANQDKFNARKEKQLAAKNSAKQKTASVNGTVTTGAEISASTTNDSKPSTSTKSSTHKRGVTEDASVKVDGKKTKTIQDDPNASDVFKSLFNTHEKAKNQTKAHWVTFNPQYF